jgi:hypothetical protein
VGVRLLPGVRLVVFVSGNPTRERAGERRVAIQQAQKTTSLVRDNLSPGVVDPAGNNAGSLSGSSTIAVLNDGKILAATLTDIGAVIGGGGGGTYTAGSVDFGASGWSATTEILDGTVDNTKSILIVPKDTGGEAAWDGIVYSCEAFSGRFNVHAVAVPGPVSGVRSFLYTVVG